MWKRAFAAARLFPARRRLSAAAAAAVDSELRHSVEEHYREVSKIASPPKKVIPPLPFSFVKGALDRSEGPVIRRTYGDEEVTISVVRQALALSSREGGDEDAVDNGGGGFITELFLHVGVSKPGRINSLVFLCGLYPDAVGIHSVCLLSKLTPGLYQGRVFQELNQKLRDKFCQYLEDRGVDKRLFPFLQSWLYLKDHRNLMKWFKNISNFVSGSKPA